MMCGVTGRNNEQLVRPQNDENPFLITKELDLVSRKNGFSVGGNRNRLF